MTQLKKANFLKAVPATPTTRGKMVDILEEYEFLPEWLTFLISHFVAQGKIIQDEDGNICRKAPKSGSSASREVHQVVQNDDGEYALVSRILGEGESINKDEGEAQTVKRAIKNEVSKVFAAYMATTKSLKALDSDEGEAVEEEAA